MSHRDEIYFPAKPNKSLPIFGGMLHPDQDEQNADGWVCVQIILGAQFDWIALLQVLTSEKVGNPKKSIYREALHETIMTRRAFGTRR